MTTELPTQDAVEQTQETQAPNLQISDLVFIAQIIQTVVQRGAVQADEMEVVGGLYTRLIDFLKSTGALVPQQPQDQEQDTAQASELQTSTEETKDA